MRAVRGFLRSSWDLDRCATLVLGVIVTVCAAAIICEVFA